MEIFTTLKSQLFIKSFDLYFANKRKKAGREWYYNQFIAFNVIHFCKNFNSINYKRDLKFVKEEIQFNKLKFGINLSDLEKKCGKPNYFQTINSDNYKIEILFFKDYVRKPRLQIFYLINNIFVMGETVYESPDKEVLKAVLNSFTDKYLCADCNPEDIILTDKNGSFLYLDNSTVLKLTYFNMNSFIKMMESTNSKDSNYHHFGYHKLYSMVYNSI